MPLFRHRMEQSFVMFSPNSVAIVGIGGLFPGAPTLGRFWENILGRRCVAREAPPGRWLLDVEDAYGPTVGAPDRVYSRRACFLDEIPRLVDAQGLDIRPDVLERLDPLYHLLLYAGTQAFDDGVTTHLNRRRTGVIVGNLALPTEQSSALARKYLGRIVEEQVLGRAARGGVDIEHLNRYVTGLPAGVLAKALGLGGAVFTLDAACASSLYAIKLAVDELVSGRADAMLAGGVARPDSLYTQMGFSQLRALSPSGVCSPFDARGDGLVVGEGAGILLLKRTEDALRDGDRVYATIAGIGLSNDVGGSLLAPMSEGQLRAMRAAYTNAGWTPGMVDLIECHATGTPVGDATEFNSLLRVWEDCDAQSKACAIGSVKANIGHLLTAAGSAAMIKVLLALKHKMLPPSANFESPAQGVHLEESPFTVLQAPQPWESADTPRRAAVSAFGFGGINAHVLVEEWRDREPSESLPIDVTAPESDAIAIVGMDAWVGPWSTLRALQERLLGGGEAHVPRAPARWWGAEHSAWFEAEGLSPQRFPGYYIDDIAFPLDRFRIPPRELEEMLPQQLLMLQVAARAFSDADYTPEMGARTGVFVGLGLDLHTTDFSVRWGMLTKAREWAAELGLNLTPAQMDAWVARLRDAVSPPLSANRTMGALGSIVASRIAREFRVGGPSFTVSSEESSGLRALDVAVRALRQGDVDQALVGAVDLAGDLRAVLGMHRDRPLASEGVARPLTASAAGTVMGEGAGALVLKRLSDAEREGNRVYAVIRGVGTAHGGGVDEYAPDADAIAEAMRRAWSDAGVGPESLGLLECHASGCPQEDLAESQAVASLFGDRETPCSLSGAKALVGHTGAASGILSIIHTALCLYQEILPPFGSGDSLHGVLGALRGVAAPPTPRYWLRNRAEDPRRAGVTALSVDGTCGHVVLEERLISGAGVDAAEQLQPLGVRAEGLFVVEAHNASALGVGLNRLRAHAEQHEHLDAETLARLWWKENREEAQKPLAVALVARDAREAIALVDVAHQHLAASPDARYAGDDPLRRDRIFFSPEPLGRKGHVAFVFPGSGNHYLDMGRELWVQWPEILRRQDRENQHLRDQFQPDVFWDGGPIEAVNQNHKATIFGQVALGTAVSDLIQRFGVRPGAVVGYSLGETAGLFALRAWTARDEMLQRMNASTLFTHELAGEYNAVRKAWKLPSSKTVDWVLGVIDRPAKVVRAAAQDHKKVYRLIVNTLHECVIGGDRKAVERLVKKLECEFFPLQGVTTVHCEVAQEVAEPYRALHVFDTSASKDVRFYSGAWGTHYRVSRDSAADSILAQAVQGIDFPKVVNAAYHDGARVFIEMGPGASCSRMIATILEGKPHVARSACQAGQDAVSGILRVLAMLVTERVPVDVSVLYGQETRVHGAHRPKTAAHMLMIPVGGRPIRAKRPPTDEEIPSPPHDDTTEEGFAPAAEEFPSFTSTEIAEQAPAWIAGDASGGDSYAWAAAVAPYVAELQVMDARKAEAHEAYLRFSNRLTEMYARNAAMQSALIQAYARGEAPSELLSFAAIEPHPAGNGTKPLFNRAQCMEIAVGSLARVLGPTFAEVDTYPTRVRLPDEPLMLVDRILELEGEAKSLSHGRLVTEHDVHTGTWYLDNGVAPICIAVEAGQADLFLSGYLGIDFVTKGKAMYRLLDAEVTFQRGLPQPGQILHYDIRILNFFRQGQTHLFRFEFDGTVDGEPLLTMRNGCAGFFGPEQLATGQGVVKTAMDLAPMPGVCPEGWSSPVPMVEESYDDAQLDALRRGDLAACFGPRFANLPVARPLTLPGGRMKLVHRIERLEPDGGRFGLGRIRGEADIHPDDWFLTCHFSDDQVMPGTLMFECCFHTLRVFLLRMGWVPDADRVVCGPVPGVASKLKCRGQVIPSTKTVTYEVAIKEIGYNPDAYVIADALMYADGKPVVDIANMCLQYKGFEEAEVRALWSGHRAPARRGFSYEQILQFCEGDPSECFGPRYAIFDEGAARRCARLPRPPFTVMSRVTEAAAEPLKLAAGGPVVVEYDVPADAWYFDSNRQDLIPFSILLEMALQPCGFYAAYAGSALTNEVDLKFRNLGGRATLHTPVDRNAGTVTTRVKMTNVSRSAGMILEDFALEMRQGDRPIYSCTTNFGFFSETALRNQVGIRDAALYVPSADESERAEAFPYPAEAPFPDDTMRMVDRVTAYVADGGPSGLGFIEGETDVDAEAWFFQAHFYQDPVWPGSLGLESFLQLLKVVAAKRWSAPAHAVFDTMAPGREHRWMYRGQIIPSNATVTVQAWVTDVDEAQRMVVGAGYLVVDGKPIYRMDDFAIRMLA